MRLYRALSDIFLPRFHVGGHVRHLYKYLRRPARCRCLVQPAFVELPTHHAHVPNLEPLVGFKHDATASVFVPMRSLIVYLYGLLGAVLHPRKSTQSDVYRFIGVWYVEGGDWRPQLLPEPGRVGWPVVLQKGHSDVFLVPLGL